MLPTRFLDISQFYEMSDVQKRSRKKTVSGRGARERFKICYRGTG
jgi:hypothetical protein